TLTVEQFKGELPKDHPLTDAQAKELQAVLQEETRSAIGRAGLALDFQAVPMMNFQNFADDATMNTSLALLDEIYNNAATRAEDFLNADQLGKFREFHTNAVSVSRASIVINRKMMSPGSFGK